MNDKDRHELEVLKTQLLMLQTQALERDHQLMALRIHAAKQDAQLERLLALVGLFKEDLDQSDALTIKDDSLLLRMRRQGN